MNSWFESQRLSSECLSEAAETHILVTLIHKVRLVEIAIVYNDRKCIKYLYNVIKRLLAYILVHIIFSNIVFRALTFARSRLRR